MAEEALDSRRSDRWLGTTFSDRYLILSLLGEGGMGLVYQARHTLMNRLVAIKIIRQELLDNSISHHRFKQEAMAVSKLNHPNIVSVYDYGVSDDGTSFLVMDYLDGISLADLIADEGALPLGRALNIYLQACRALQHAHERGIIHRDFKSSNLMVCRENGKGDVVKVVDFGMAKLLRPECDSDRFQELTQTGDVFGSPIYMSPEQCRGQKLDERSDIYSLGCVMYYGLTGQPPCKGDNVLDTLQRQINEMPAPVIQLMPDTPAGLNEVILKALRKEPDERYQTMSALIDDLESIVKTNKRAVVTQQMKKPDFDRITQAVPGAGSAAGAGGSVGSNSGSGSASIPPSAAIEKKSWSAHTFLGLPLGHNFELSIVFATFICTIVFVTAFVSGRIFEEAGNTQEQNVWIDRNIEGDHARAGGRFAEAESCYKEAILEAQKFGANDPRLAKSLYSLGATYAQDHQYARAENSLKRAMQILAKCYGADCSELSAPLATLARVYDAQGHDKDAQALRERARNLIDAPNSSGVTSRRLP